MYWHLKHKVKETDPHSRLEEIKKILFLNRGLTDQDKQNLFLNPPFPDLDSLLKVLPDLDQEQLQKAVTRIKKAIKDEQPIFIYGDYDCDGVSATAILWRNLYDLGAKVRPFIPHRITHGYGLSEIGLKELLENPFLEGKKPLIITVDNGITATKSAEFLKSKAIDLIITDHHQAHPELPSAYAIVHTTLLSGSGVAWLLSASLTPKPQLLGLAALGTVCDLLPVIGPNRQIITHGLNDLKNTKNLGLRALYQASGVTDPKALTTYHLGFTLGPRINAVGRLGHALDALRLLCTTKTNTALDLASKLSKVNTDRQDLTMLHTQAAIEHFKGQKNLPNLLLIANSEYHEGIIGLIASRLTEYFNRPSIAVSLQTDLAKASARSLGDINITELIAEAKEHLLGYGGHHGAAGFSFHPDKFETIQNILAASADKLDEKMFIKSLDIEIELNPSGLNYDLLQLIEEFAPFGVSNPRPLFATTLEVASHRIIGKNNDHLKIFTTSPYQSLDIIGFNMADKAKDLKKAAKFAFSLDKNFFNGKTSLQLLLKDIVPV